MKIPLIGALVCSGLYFLDAILQDTFGLSTIALGASLFLGSWGGIDSLCGSLQQWRAPIIVPSKDYGWSLGRTVTLGVLALTALTIISLLAGFVVAFNAALALRSSAAPIAANNLEGIVSIILLQVTGFVVMGGYYFVGRWIGYKCRERGMLAVLVVILAFFGLSFIINTSSLGFTAYTESLSDMNVSFWQIVVAIPIMFAIGLVGYWRGRRNRLSHYFHYLIRSLPYDTGKVVVDLAYSETVELKRKA